MSNQTENEVFQKYAPQLNAMRYVPDSRYFYELMSGAIVWEDEKEKLPFEISNLLRLVWAYRTSLYIKKPRVEFESTWDAAKEAFPNWPGFKKERIEPKEEVITYFHEAKRKSNRRLDLTDEVISGRREFLSGKGKCD